LKTSSRPNLHVILIHYPVVSKNGDIIASAVTNLDLHDIARAGRTYGIRSFYIVTPVRDQLELVDKIVSHWISGTGAAYNPKRREALSIIRVSESFEAALKDIAAEDNGYPKTIVTSARKRANSLQMNVLRDMIRDGGSYALVLGTAWGLTDDFLNQADYLLEPICGPTDYNHLSVRSAAAIMLDRLLGK
jgi:hypothetical protein